MSELYYESSLAHYGVKGMRWGHISDKMIHTPSIPYPGKQRYTPKDLKRDEHKKTQTTEDLIAKKKAKLQETNDTVRVTKIRDRRDKRGRINSSLQRRYKDIKKATKESEQMSKLVKKVSDKTFESLAKNPNALNFKDDTKIHDRWKEYFKETGTEFLNSLNDLNFRR